MKKNLAIYGVLLLLWTSIAGMAQNAFMRSIDINNELRSNNGSVIIDTGSGFMIVAASGCFGIDLLCMDYVSVGYDGTVAWSKNYSNPNYPFSTAWNGLIQNQLLDYPYTIFCITAKNDTSYGFMQYMGENGDTLSNAMPFTSNSYHLSSGWIEQEDGYLTLYTSGFDEQPSHAVLQKVFADGSLGFSKKFNPTPYTSGVGLNKSLDGDLMIGLYVFDINEPQKVRFQLLRTNAVGDSIWSRWLPPVKVGIEPAIEMISLPNGNTVVAWSKDTLIYVPGQPLYNEYPPTLFCYSPDGELLWTHVFVTMGWKYLTNLAVASNGDILGSGYVGNDMSGMLFRISPEGNIVWEHYYYNSYNADVPLFPLFDLVEMADGRIAATGAVLTDLGQGMLDYDLGLLIVDAQGCIDGSCGDTIFLSATNEGQAWFNLHRPKARLFPNPANQYLSIEPPSQMWQQLPIYISLYNLLGQEVLSKVCHVNQTINLDVSDIPNGTYLYQIKSDYPSKGDSPYLQSGKISILH
jgi:hypothetical protein